MSQLNPPARKIRPCPICAKPSEELFRPFCSRRCADVDLNRWLKGSYAIPVVEEDEEPDRERDPEAGDGGAR